MPAPPDESEPAMVSAMGTVIVLLAGIQTGASGSCSVLARRVIASKFLSAILNPNATQRVFRKSGYRFCEWNTRHLFVKSIFLRLTGCHLAGKSLWRRQRWFHS